MKLEDLMREADEMIEKRASKVKVAAVATDEDAEIAKLAASFLDVEIPAKQEKIASTAQEETPFEKIAHAIAIVETLLNIEELQKIASFEESAKAKGFSDIQIEEFMEKKANLKPVHKYVTIPGALLALGAGAGHVHGKKSGYKDALNDVSRAMSGQGEQ